MKNYPSRVTLHRHRLLVFGTLLITPFVGASSDLWAQSATTGGLHGTVVDLKGGVVPNAVVVLNNAATRQTQTAVTDANGRYGFSLLPPGTYDVAFSVPGVKTAAAMSVVVNVSEAPELRAQLEAGAAEERVKCQCQLSQATESSSGTLVNSKTLTAVPLTTRNLTQVLSMSSGSAASVNNAGLLGTGSQDVNVNGSTAVGVYTVDGAATTTRRTSIWIGLARVSIAPTVRSRTSATICRASGEVDGRALCQVVGPFPGSSSCRVDCRCLLPTATAAPPMGSPHPPRSRFAQVQLTKIL
jgi:Carboxypeptidase regulatory-like domain